MDTNEHNIDRRHWTNEQDRAGVTPHMKGQELTGEERPGPAFVQVPTFMSSVTTV
jgi:hypothetical protein